MGIELVVSGMACRLDGGTIRSAPAIVAPKPGPQPTTSTNNPIDAAIVTVNVVINSIPVTTDRSRPDRGVTASTNDRIVAGIMIGSPPLVWKRCSGAL
ncbi:MAG: hypothetical protein ABEH65_03670 [Halobacteriales archaeon]